MDTKKTILKHLPNTFDRQYLLKFMTTRNYSITYADSVLEALSQRGDIQRIARGRYKKTA
jgi:hypothetical protein